MDFNLRPWTIADLDSLVLNANNWNVSKNMTDKFPYPYTETDGRAFIEFASKAEPMQIFAIAIEGKASGGIGIHPQDDIHRLNAELGYWLAEPFWGKGLMSNAVKQMVDYAFTTFTIERIFARPFGTNIASQKVLEKNHFSLEARFKKALIKNNVCIDELIYAIRRENWRN